MRLYLHTFILALDVVAIWALALVGIDLLAQPSSSADISGKITAVVLGVVVLAFLLVSTLSVMKKDRLINRIVREVVGIMPGQIDEWKWREHAILKVEDRLRQLAGKIKYLDIDEKDLLRRISATPEKILEMHREVKETLREFREVHDVFQNSFDFKLKDSWNDYVS